MIQATIEYADGTRETVKKKSYIELAAYVEKERGKGAVGFHASSETDEGRPWACGKDKNGRKI